MNKTIIAIPSEQPGGLEATVSGHFGHCDVYTLAEVVDNKVVGTKILPNIAHTHGGCLAPVQHLVDNGVNVLVAAGMGKRPLAGFQSKGVTVYHNSSLTKTGEIIQAFIDGKLAAFSMDSVCQGGCDH